MSKTIRFNVIGDTITLPKYPSFNSGSKGYYTARFTFDKAWDGLIPHIAIIENGTKRADEVIVDGTHKIAVTESGTMQIGVHGIDAEGKKCISCGFVSFKVQKGAYDKAPALPSDIWEGYRLTVLGYVDRAENAAEIAKEVKSDVETVQMLKQECFDFSTTSGENAAAAQKAAEKVTNMTAEAVTGTEASVNVHHKEYGIHLDFTLPQGEPGEKGDAGSPGADGYTPKKGVDYWTEEDKAEIKDYVEEAILGGAW